MINKVQPCEITKVITSMATVNPEEEEEIAPNEGQEEQKFRFETEEMENEHVQIKRRMASWLGKETIAVQDLNKLIKKQMERG